MGFRHAFFEDNYPPGQGDCYSLKKVLSHAGFKPTRPVEKTAVNRAKARVRRLLGVREDPLPEIAPNAVDEAYLQANVEAYYEFPPLFRRELTRWGDRWSDDRYPTPAPLLERVDSPFQQIYFNEALDYTWICYVRLK